MDAFHPDRIFALPKRRFECRERSCQHQWFFDYPFLHYDVARDVVCSAGVFNMLKCTKQRPVSVCTLVDKVNGSHEQLEGNLSTVLQSVRGSKQYWFFRQGEVRCMIREFGSPTLFLTLSCAEYESPEIITYLRKVNTVPSSYDIRHRGNPAPRTRALCSE